MYYFVLYLQMYGWSDFGKVVRNSSLWVASSFSVENSPFAISPRSNAGLNQLSGNILSQ